MTSHTTSPSSDGSASKFSSGSGSGGGSAGFLDGFLPGGGGGRFLPSLGMSDRLGLKIPMMWSRKVRMGDLDLTGDCGPLPTPGLNLGRALGRRGPGLAFRAAAG